MHRCQDNGLVYYQFASLAPYAEVVHGVFTRLGGVSQPPFASLNLGLGVGDDPTAVEENYQRICQTMGIERTSLVTGYQVHSDHVVVVGSEGVGRRFPNTDALISNCPEVALTLRFADCVPILFFDPRQRAVGIAHAGWKGTLNKIGVRTVEAMAHTFGSRPADIIACIGPSIGPCCYEVQDDVIGRVLEAFPNERHLLLEKANGAIHFDLWQANRRALELVGVSQIETAEMCTACRSDEFFSHRREAGKTGRFGAFIGLKHRLT